MHWRTGSWTLASLAVACQSYAAVGIGQKAVDFTLTDHAGQRASLSEYRGKVVLLQMTNLT